MKNKKNSGKGNFSVYFTTILMAVVIFFTIISLVFGGIGNLPKLPNLKLGRVIAVFLLILAINITVAVLSFIIARKTQWTPILWLNKRLFSTVQKRKDAPPKFSGLFKKFSDRYNPERVLDLKQKDVPYGTFLSEPNEEFIEQEHPFFYRSWMAHTVYSTLLLIIKNVLLISLISAFFLLISRYFFTLALLFSVTIFVLQILYYWKKEWERYTEIFFITTHRFGYVKGQFSWAGLLFRSGVDISFKEYDFTFLGPTYVDPVPDNITLSPIFEFFIETLANSQERVGTLKLHIIGYGMKDEDLILDNFSYANYIKATIDKAQVVNRNIQEDEIAVNRKSRSHRIGDPGKYANQDIKQMQVDEWEGTFQKGESKLIDIFQLVRVYIERLVNAKVIEPHPVIENNSNITSDGSPIIIDPNRFPGKDE